MATIKHPTLFSLLNDQLPRRNHGTGAIDSLLFLLLGAWTLLVGAWSLFLGRFTWTR
jgi:hypothetical protein